MPANRPTAAIYTLGCKANQYESEAIAEALSREGFLVCDFKNSCDVYIINTCTVTAESDRKSRQIIRRARSKNPDARIIVCGCYAQAAGADAGAMEAADYICGTRNKMSVVAAAKALLAGAASPRSDIPETDSLPYETMSIEKSERTRAYVKIEDGCENRCAYCIIPYARGRVVSRPENEVLEELSRLAASGYREAVLTGIETASYGRDLQGVTLRGLLQKADRIPGIERIRLGSLDPSLMTRSFCDAIAGLSKTAPHFHLSLQSGSSSVLRRMRRRYTAETAMKNIEYLRHVLPGCNISTDIMTGFPGETEEEFEETLHLARQARFLHIHIFTYSKRKGTPAETMPDQVPEPVKIERARRLSALQDEIDAEYRRRHIEAGTVFDILFEDEENGYFSGHSPDFTQVLVQANGDLHNQILPVRVTGEKDGCLTGVLLK